jgi:hypothetical protein
MTVTALRTRTPEQVREDVNGFAQRYVKDWQDWLDAPAPARPVLFGEILRRWQATRPFAMRRIKAQASHRAPFLEDLLDHSAEPLATIDGLTLANVSERTAAQDLALHALWRVFKRLPVEGSASCVGITKALLLLTDGRIGPALDSQVRKKTRVGRPESCAEWLRCLQDVSEDIAEFERVHGPLSNAVDQRFQHLSYGRLYDMALGPR